MHPRLSSVIHRVRTNARWLVKHNTWHELIASSGLLDTDWLEAQLGRSFDTYEEAVDVYLRADEQVSPHPLFEPSWIARGRHKPWSRQNLSPLIWYLDDAHARATVNPHPLFDIARLPEPDVVHELGPLAAWLATATDATPLPAGAGIGPVTWGRFREIALAAAREQRTHRNAIEQPRHVSERPSNLIRQRDVDTSGLTDSPTPLVSVVMPTWNRAASLRDAVASVQAQSFPGWELIIADDGSTDDTLAVLTGVAKYDDRVVVVPLEHGGVCRARNEAIARARGKYVAFLDSDNTWTPEFLAVMLATLEREDWTMAHAAIATQGRKGRRYRALEGTYEHLLVANHVDMNVLVARTEAVRAVGGFDESLRRAVDYDLILKLAEQHELHLVPFIGADYEDNDDPSRISNREPVTWNQVVCAKRLIDWDAVADNPRDPDRTSIVVALRDEPDQVLAWWRAMDLDDNDVDLSFVCTRPRRLTHVLGRTAEATGRWMRWHYLRTDLGTPAAIGRALSEVRGERLVYVTQAVDPAPDGLVMLADRLRDPGVALAQPLLLKPNATVLSAGAVFGRGGVRPVPFLNDHPVRDARLEGPLDLPAAYGAVGAVRTTDFIAARGFDPIFGDVLAEVDLSLRLAERGGRIVLDPDTRLVYRGRELRPRTDYIASVDLLEQRWPAPPTGTEAAFRAAGFDVIGHTSTTLQRGEQVARFAGPEDSPLVIPQSRVVPRRIRVSEGRPQLRWAIDTAAPPGPKGRTWGDTYFADSLACALERLGQRVAVDNRDLRHRATRDHDDVILVLRGLDPVTPRPGAVNLEWVISHPERLDRGEVTAFDRVFAASVEWSTEMSEQWRTPITPLLQCTDPALFSPERRDEAAATEVLFVGTSRRIYRRAVRTAVAIGAPLSLYGGDWEPSLPAEAITATHVDNTELGRLYASAGIVLNDHWEDMRQNGFISNRVFDAAASGARVASDAVVGLDHIFGGLVQTFEDEAGLRLLLDERDNLFPDEDGRLKIAETVRTEHSFAARAEVLLEEAIRIHRARS